MFVLNPKVSDLYISLTSCSLRGTRCYPFCCLCIIKVSDLQGRLGVASEIAWAATLSGEITWFAVWSLSLNAKTTSPTTTDGTRHHQGRKVKHPHAFCMMNNLAALPDCNSWRFKISLIYRTCSLSVPTNVHISLRESIPGFLDYR